MPACCAPAGVGHSVAHQRRRSAASRSGAPRRGPRGRSARGRRPRAPACWPAPGWRATRRCPPASASSAAGSRRGARRGRAAQNASACSGSSTRSSGQASRSSSSRWSASSSGAASVVERTTHLLAGLRRRGSSRTAAPRRRRGRASARSRRLQVREVLGQVLAQHVADPARAPPRSRSGSAPSSSFCASSGSAPAISQRTARRSKRNSTPRCQASSRDSGEPRQSRLAYSAPRGGRHARRAARARRPRRPGRWPRAPRAPRPPRRRLRRPTVAAPALVTGGATRSGMVARLSSAPTRPSRKRELGRGERVLPGVWRLRLPLPWPGIPHCNAWALAAGDGVVLVDTGMHEPGLARPPRAGARPGRAAARARAPAWSCTHAHPDHYGQAAPILERAGCELWMHPDHAHLTAAAATPRRRSRGRLEIGAPERACPRRRCARCGAAAPRAGRRRLRADRRGRPRPARRRRDRDRPRRRGDVIETPGHAPSHVCLYQPERRLLISGDHLLGRVSLYFDYGCSPDPVGEFLRSLDKVDGLDARLAWPATGGRSPTSAATSRPTARSSRSASSAVRPRCGPVR